ncbi:MAG: hypothetical protein PQJ44_06995 [Sphaerochaetaceae bacterium]|nr:hypothetical protein [Sphaerochaetaceae bacterium]
MKWIINYSVFFLCAMSQVCFSDSYTEDSAVYHKVTIHDVDECIDTIYTFYREEDVSIDDVFGELIAQLFAIRTELLLEEIYIDIQRIEENENYSY